MSKDRSPRDVCSTTMGTRSCASKLMSLRLLAGPGGRLLRLLLLGLGLSQRLGRVLLVDLHVVHQPPQRLAPGDLLAQQGQGAVATELLAQLLGRLTLVEVAAKLLGDVVLGDVHAPVSYTHLRAHETRHD